MSSTAPVSLLDAAQMITADADRGRAILLATTVRLERDPEAVRSARLVSTAHGVYEARVDGRPVDDAVLRPGWTAYEWRLQVQDVDVTALVRGGPRETVVEVLLGNGWYRGDLGFEGAKASYGTDIGFLGVLEVTFDDGTVQTVASSPAWTARLSDTTENSLYDGQRIDARLRAAEPTALPVRVVDLDRSVLVPQVGPRTVRQEVLPARRVWTSPSGRTLVDFGQNLVGWVRFTVSGPEGTEIVVRHAEVLEDGELGTRPLRSARATDTFVLSGGTDSFEPTLTFHGFRYAEVTGWPGELTTDDLEAVVVHSAMRRTSEFTCSDPLVNQLVHNAVWGQKGNFLDVPTDCPQRDERLGWTGDIAAFAASASFQFDTADFLHKWLLDLAEETRHAPGGAVPYVVPEVMKHGDVSHWDNPFDTTPTAVWGDAAVWVPEALWRAYGDESRLAAHYPAMVMHLESVEAALSPSGLWDQGFQFGDWLDPDASPHEPAKAKADPGVVATACLFRSATFAAEAAGVLGRADDAERWAALARRTRAAFSEHYVDGGRVTSDCTTVYALAIAFGLLDDADRAAAADRLAELVRESGYRVTTGFAGTPFITWALSETGHVEEAYRLLLEKECPSWLYPVTMGATTVWERWDSMLPDGSINPGEMTSFNHYALGAVVDWVYQVVAGIRPAAPGYAEVLVQPVPGPGIDHVRAAYESRAGRIEVEWTHDAGAFVLDVSIPDGVPAEIVLPDGKRTRVTGGTHHLTA
ncbi:family 78 glycoside hydrolase catalytic domain [Cellulosimicrobium cellulans]|uniref:family 78 glycoside hydrolase catalytic domain n=1 Tax=Cellulosimicrobium cellulans TaxID=1710 RepID=UPI000848F451|nr:family 78 glycoside hydrolase catalytic domain [Cellulosimicrobium cellulans]